MPEERPASDLDESQIEEFWSLGAQLPTIPPDEIPGLKGVREMSDDEVRQAQADTALLQKLAPIAPYFRAERAVDALAKIVDELGTLGQTTLSGRGQNRLQRVLTTVTETLNRLPEELSTSLQEQLGPESEPARRLAEEKAQLLASHTYRIARELESIPLGHVVVVSDEEITELALSPEGVAAWSGAVEALDAEQPIGLVSLAESALVESQRLVSRWLLEHAGVVREASLRLQQLSAEVIEGHPILLRVSSRRSPDEEPEVLNMTPSPLPIEQIYGLQAAMLRAERLLEDDEAEPALRGLTGVHAGQVRAAMEDLESGEPPTDGDGGDRTIESEEDEEPGPPALDLEALVAHLELGAVSLERAWSRALDQDDVENLLGKWTSLIEAIRSEMARADREMPEEERYISEFPPPAAEVARLPLEPGSVDPRYIRLAQLTALTALIKSIPALREPTLRLTVKETGRRIEWFSSGAFAALRGHRALVSQLLRLDPTPRGNAAVVKELAGGSWQRSYRLALEGEVHSDPEAVLIHLAQALAQHPSDAEARVSRISAPEREVLDHTTEAARRLDE